MNRRAAVLDVALTAAFVVVAACEAGGHWDDGFLGTAPPLVAALSAAVAPLPLVIRRRRPVAVLLAVSALVSLPHLLVGYDPVFLGGACALVVAAESVGRYGARPAARFALAAPAAGVVVIAVTVPGFAGDAPVSAGLVLGGWTVGVLVRALGERRDALRGELAARVDAEALATEAAVSAERTRIARELHDVIAHCVGVMVLQAGAARLQLGTAPDAAADAIGTVDRVGHEALVELQRVLGLLRAGVAAPAGSIASIDLLADDLRAAGLPVRLAVRGDVAGLPPGLDASLYRVVQESLTNALKHGSGDGVDVRLVVSAAGVELEVVNSAGSRRHGLPGGHGQTGMRERIAAFGGALETGLEAGRYRVHAVVPVGPA